MYFFARRYTELDIYVNMFPLGEHMQGNVGNNCIPWDIMYCTKQADAWL